MTELSISSKTQQLQQLKNALINLTTNEEPLVIRSALDLFDLQGWHNYLKNELNFQEDRRHFNFDSKIQMADWWEISYQPKLATSYAYSKTRQPLHNDNAWFADPAEINFFAMVKQATSGGEQTIYPISRLLNDLYKKQPGLLNDLLTHQVVIKKGNGSEEHITTILTQDPTPRCYWNFYRTDKSDPTIERMCNHFFKFLESQESTTSVQRIHCKTGDCMAFNDSLLLHGREAFEASEPFDRILYQSMWNITP